ncbi:hypothetical protein GWI33_003813 [Rhynchophorus ferrugineus]|uniref:Uncharacterized protein n=1 Tax=Rhynchophorus ferrugineus TaxID=354439 RepID=A0A834HN32_RHYFE|nr:hypothetical protein GWI33_003813 [Rhynchophorus ferrugineus]
MGTFPISVDHGDTMESAGLSKERHVKVLCLSLHILDGRESSIPGGINTKRQEKPGPLCVEFNANVTESLVFLLTEDNERYRLESSTEHTRNRIFCCDSHDNGPGVVVAVSCHSTSLLAEAPRPPPS